MTNNLYFMYLDRVFANVKKNDKILVRIDCYISWFVDILRKYSFQKELDILMVFDDNMPMNFSNLTKYSYYIYFLHEKPKYFAKNDIESFIVERKKTYDSLNLKKYIQSGNWMIACLPSIQKDTLHEWISSEKMNYVTMSRKSFPLYAKLCKARTITIVQQDIRLSFSYSPDNVFTCFGEHNIPDGEIGVIPIEETVNGTIYFEKVNFHGFVFHNLLLNFHNGKCSSYSCNEYLEFEKILNFDSRSMYIGEFAFGLNPYIKEESNFALLDEKRIGTFHLALGGAENINNNIDASFIHMDMISKATSICEIYADDELIFYENQFVGRTLKTVNMRR